MNNQVDNRQETLHIAHNIDNLWESIEHLRKAILDLQSQARKSEVEDKHLIKILNREIEVLRACIAAPSEEQCRAQPHPAKIPHKTAGVKYAQSCRNCEHRTKFHNRCAIVDLSFSPHSPNGDDWSRTAGTWICSLWKKSKI
jgi:hypothetical protein